MTTVRVPVLMTASEGTTRPSVAAVSSETFTNMPGARAWSRLSSSMRARIVRVATSTSGRMACTVPAKADPGSAGELAFAATPGRSNAA